MSEIGLYEAMSTLRAVRKLRPDPIPDDIVRRVFQAACWAPTGGNRQVWRMIAVRDPVLKARLGEMYGEVWTPFAADYAKMAEGMSEEEQARMGRVLDAGTRMGEHLGETPIAVVVCHLASGLAVTDIDQDRIPVVGGGSIYPAVQNLMLACRAEGLGCVLTTLLCQVEPEVKALLNIPDEWATSAMVPIGYPVGKGHGSITRKPVEELIHTDKFGAAFA